MVKDATSTQGGTEVIYPDVGKCKHDSEGGLRGLYRQAYMTSVIRHNCGCWCYSTDQPMESSRCGRHGNGREQSKVIQPGIICTRRACNRQPPPPEAILYLPADFIGLAFSGLALEQDP